MVRGFVGVTAGTYQNQGIAVVRPGKHHVGALGAIHGNVNVNADLLEVLRKHLLVDRVVLHEKNLVSLVAHPLLNLQVAGLLSLHHLLGGGPVSVDTEIPHLVGVENDGEPRWLDWLVDESDLVLGEELAMRGVGGELQDCLPLDRVGQDEDRGLINLLRL